MVTDNSAVLNMVLAVLALYSLQGAHGAYSTTSKPQE